MMMLSNTIISNYRQDKKSAKLKSKILTFLGPLQITFNFENHWGPKSRSLFARLCQYLCNLSFGVSHPTEAGPQASNLFSYFQESGRTRFDVILCCSDVKWRPGRKGRVLSITGCSGKFVFFHNSLQPLPRLHRYVQSSQRNASVQSLLLAGNIFYNK